MGDGHRHPYRGSARHGTYAEELTDPAGRGYALAEWDVTEERVQELVAAAVPWAVRRCPPSRPGGGDEDVLWPLRLAPAERREWEQAALVPWTATPSAPGTRKLRRRAWQASVWRSQDSNGGWLLLFEEGS